MEFLLTKTPQYTGKFKTKEVKDYYTDLVEDADMFNIATGFVSNASILELEDLIKYRQKSHKAMKLNLFIGMNYLEQFTRLQYEALKELNSYLLTDKLGNIYLSKESRYHGKMYSFIKDDICQAGFIGSSNLGSFLGTSTEYIEADLLLQNEEANLLNKRINNIIEALGTKFSDVPEISEFKKPIFNLLDDNNYVNKLSEEKYVDICSGKLDYQVDVPLKVGDKAGKSNLNTYFGAGKIKGRFSPRNWYEAEIIISKKLPNLDKLPKEDEIFTVVTDDHFMFKCKRQGDFGKNLRTLGDLRILGKWIKGHMEAEGALKLGEMVTDDTLNKFHKSKLVFTPTKSGIWLLKME